MSTSLGDPYLFASGAHARLGDPSMFPLPPEPPEGDEELDERVQHDPQLAILTLAIRDLTDAVRELTATLDRPNWWVRIWRWIRDRWTDTGEG